MFLPRIGCTGLASTLNPPPMSRPLEEWLDEAETALDTADAAGALAAAEAALGIDPTSLDAQLLKATALAELERIDEADALFATLLAREPDDLHLKLAAANAKIRLAVDDRDRVEEGL